MLRFALLVVLFLPLLASCGGSDDPVAPNGGVVDLLVTPAETVIGGMVEIRGLDTAGLAPADVVVRIGGQEAYARPAHGGAVLASVPIFTDDEGLAPVPTDPVDVEVLVAGTRAGFAEATLAVLMPPAAPGAVQDVSTSILSIVDDVEAVATVLAPTPSLEEGYATALFGALRELIVGEDSNSLASQLAELESEGNDEALALAEGILAGAGVVERLETVAALLDDLAVQTEQFAPGDLARRTTELSQYDLAARMQLYVMVRDVGQQVIGESTADWGAFVGPIVGGMGLVGGVPGVAALGTIGTILGLLNTGVNTIALSYLPAQIDSFELVVNEEFVAPGTVADTEIWITASNNPSSITTLDLVDLVLTAMGTPSGPNVPPGDPRRNALLQIIDYFLGIFRGLLSGYAAGHPGSDLAFDVASIPHWTWRAQVTDTRFVSPRSLTPAIIDANGNDILAWRAATNTTGEGRIFAQIETGPDVTSLVQIPSYTYTAGAFGDDPRATETQSVHVAAPLLLTTSMDPSISPGGTNGLEARVGTVTATGDTLYLQGISIECTAAGGSLSPSSGVTGADGRFDTLVTLDSGSAGVVVDVVATDSAGQSVTATTGATSESQVVVSVELPDRVGLGEDARVVVTARLLTPEGFQPAEGATISVYGENGTDVEIESGVADAAGVFTTTARIDETRNELVVEAEAEYLTFDRAEARASALRKDSVTLEDFSVIGYSEVFASWTPEDGQPSERFILEFDIEEFYEAAPSVTSSTSATGSGARDGMSVDGSTSADVTVELDRGDDGAFRGMTVSGSTATVLTVTNPTDRPYQIQSDGTIEVQIEIAVWGTAASWSLAGSSSNDYIDVEVEGGDGDLLDCNSESENCASLSGSGALPVGYYDVDITITDAVYFSDRFGQSTAGTQSESGNFTFGFEAEH